MSLGELIAITGTTSGFFILLLKKWRLDELYSMHKDRISKRLPADLCLFCICFWISVSLVLVYSIFFESNISYIVAPFGGTGLGYIIYRDARNLNR